VGGELLFMPATLFSQQSIRTTTASFGGSQCLSGIAQLAANLIQVGFPKRQLLPQFAFQRSGSGAPGSEPGGGQPADQHAQEQACSKMKKGIHVVSINAARSTGLGRFPGWFVYHPVADPDIRSWLFRDCHAKIRP
jgi:hypothetical protein